MEIPDDATNPIKKAVQDRPETSMRVTLSIGREANDRLDRLSRALSAYRAGGVSRSAVIRGLLAFAENSALCASDDIILMIDRPPSGDYPKADILDLEPSTLWEALMRSIFADSQVGG